MSTPAEKPHEKMPEHLSTGKHILTKEEKIDAQMADTFPASDPPSYSGGNTSSARPQTAGAKRRLPIIRR